MIRLLLICTLLIFLAAPMSRGASRGAVNVVDSIADLATRVGSTNAPRVMVQGARGGTFDFSLSAPNSELLAAAKTNGVYFQSANGWYTRVIEGPVEPIWWGAEGSTNYPTTPEDRLIQAAIDFSEASGINHVQFSGGIRSYLIATQLVVKSTLIDAQKLQRGATTVFSGTNAVGPPFGVKFYQSTNFVSDDFALIAIHDNGTENGTPVLRNLYLRGAKDWNQRDPKTITQIVSTNRASFFVSTNDLPDQSTLPALCFFYDDKPFYLGFGYVTNVNATTGEVLLDGSMEDDGAGYGTPYATHADDPGVLKPGWTVVFSPTASETGRLVGTLSGTSPAYAGHAGIAIIGTKTNILNRHISIDNCTIENFHAGIREGVSIFNEIKRNLIRGNSFATIAIPFPTAARDTFYFENYLSGFHVQSDLTTLESYYDFVYGRTAYGIYNMSSASFGPQLTVDGACIAYHIDTPLNSVYGLLRADQPIMHGVWLNGGAGVGADRSDFVGSILSVLATSNANDPDVWRTPRSVIITRPRAGTVSSASFTTYHSVAGNVDTLMGSEFNITTGDRVRIGQFAGIAAATNYLADGSAVPIIGNGLTQPISTHDYRPTVDTYAIATEGKRKFLLADASLGLDLTMSIIHLGADYEDGTIRTENTNKGIWLQLESYDGVPTNALVLIGGISRETSDTVFIGESGGGVRAPMTEFLGYGASSKGGAFQQWWRWTQDELHTRANISITNTTPSLFLRELDGPVGNKAAAWRANSGSVFLTLYNDDGTTNAQAITVQRSTNYTEASGLLFKTLDRGLLISATGSDTNDTGLYLAYGTNEFIKIKKSVDGSGVLFTGDSYSPGIVASATNTVVLVDDAIVAAPNLKSIGGDVKWSIDSSTNILGTVGTNAITGAKVAQGTLSTNHLDAASLALLEDRGLTSITLDVPEDLFGVTPSTLESNGTFTLVLDSQNARTFLAGPTNGSPEVPVMRTIRGEDLASAVEAGSNITITTNADNGKFIFSSTATGGGSTNSSVLVDGSVIENPNFTSDGHVKLSVSGATNILLNLSTNTPLSVLTNQPSGTWLGTSADGDGPVVPKTLTVSSPLTIDNTGATTTLDIDDADYFSLSGGTNHVSGDIGIEGDVNVGGVLTAAEFQTDEVSSDTLTVTNSITFGGVTRTNWPNGTKTIAVFVPSDALLPSSDYPEWVVRGNERTLGFDDTSSQCVYFQGVIPEAANLTSGIRLFVHNIQASATSGTNVFGLAMADLSDLDLDSVSFATETNALSVAHGTNGRITVGEVLSTFTDGLAAGEAFALRACRLPGNGSDNMNGDSQFIRLEMRTEE